MGIVVTRHKQTQDKTESNQQEKTESNQTEQTEELYTRNLDNKITVQEVRDLFGLNDTVYLQENVTILKMFEPNGRFTGYVKMKAPLHVTDLKLNVQGMKHKDRTLVIKLLSEMKSLEMNANRIFKLEGGLSYGQKGDRDKEKTLGIPGEGGGLPTVPQHSSKLITDRLLLGKEWRRPALSHR